MVEGKGRGANAWLRGIGFLADRTVVLFAGLAVGAAITLAFLGHGSVFDGAVRPVSAVPAQAPGGRRQALDCAAPIPLRLLKRVEAGRPVTIGVFGDSFGDGVWAALYRQLGKDNVKVLRLSHEGTGFTRYQSANLEDTAARQVAGEPVDLAVIVFGANDTQGLFEGKHAYAFLSPAWKTAYGGRIDRFVNVIRRQGAMVYWLGLPKMRAPGYDRDVAALNDFAAQRMTALDVPVAGAKEPRLMRANDGIHMTFPGYERLTGPLVERIRSYMARARDTVAASGHAL